MIRSLILGVVLSVTSLSVTAGEGQCDKAKGACPAGEKSKGTCPAGEKGKDAKGGCCPGKAGGDQKPAGGKA